MRSIVFASILSASTLFVATAGHSASGDPAGVVSATQGTVSRVLFSAPQQERQRGIGKDLGTGAQIFLGDEIKSGPQSRLQVLLLDETTFTIGPDSSLTIDEFIYDPTTNKGKVTARVAKGYFRFVSGKISSENPENVKINLPVASIGIRGTTVYGYTDGNTQALVGLGGPGREANNQRRGSITVTSGDTTRLIYRADFGVVVRGVGNISEPSRFYDQAQTILDALAPRTTTTAQNSLPGIGRDVVAQSDIGRDVSIVAARNETRSNKTAANNNALATDTSQTANSVQAVINSPVTTLGQLMSVNSGKISGSAVFNFEAISGTVAATNIISYSVDFGARTITRVTTFTGTLGGNPFGGSPVTVVTSYAGQNPDLLASSTITNTVSTPYGPLTQSRTVRFQNTPAGIARLAITSVQVSRSGNVARAGGPITLTPQ